MIQQAINQGLSVASLLFTQTPTYKQAERVKGIRQELKEVGRLAEYEEQEYGAPELKTLKRKQEVAEKLFETKPGEKTQETMEEAIIELDVRETERNRAARNAAKRIEQKEKETEERESRQLARSIILSRDDIAAKKALENLQQKQEIRRGGNN